MEFLARLGETPVTCRSAPCQPGRPRPRRSSGLRCRRRSGAPHPRRSPQSESVSGSGQARNSPNLLSRPCQKRQRAGVWVLAGASWSRAPGAERAADGHSRTPTAPQRRLGAKRAGVPRSLQPRQRALGQEEDEV